MPSVRLAALILCGLLSLDTTGAGGIAQRGITQAGAGRSHPFGKRSSPISPGVAPDKIRAEKRVRDDARYRLDAGRSKLMVRAFSGGLLWFLGHDHFIAAREFTGEVQLTPGAITPASLQMSVRADSLAETRDVFTEQQKQIIDKELREIVLETAKYPEITFKSTGVTGGLTAGGYQAQIGGDLTLHGVTRHIVIPAEVTLSGSELRARGEFTVKRSDYHVKATSAKGGTIRVRDKLRFTFDIVAHQL